MKQTEHGIWLPDRDEHFAEVLSHPKKKGDWGQYQTHIYRMVLKSVWERPPEARWRTAVDVGAHVGLLSMQMAPDFQRVIAFEPSADNAECFKLNVEAPNVTLYPVALGARMGAAALRLGRNNTGDNRVEVNGPPDYPVGELSKVRLHPLDMYELEDVDLIKIDVQGYEAEVLRGACDTINKNKPVLLIEEVGLGGGEHAIYLLNEWGYQEAERWTKDRVMTWQG
jgi:FkbM family methyltransferase